MQDERFEIEYDELAHIVSLNDKKEQIILVMTLEEVEKMLEWYCDKFQKIVI